MSVTNLPERQTPIGVGEVAPDFTLKTQSRDDWSLSEAVKRSDVVICFYPFAFSPVCSTEMQCLSDELDTWRAKGAEPVGVSCDSVMVQEAWAGSLGLKHTLLADMHREVCRAYGFYWPELNVSGRGTVVIGQSDDGRGKVKWVQRREIGNGMDKDELLGVLG